MSSVRSEAPEETVADAQDDPLGARLAGWRSELEATADRGQRAVLFYEIANLLERSGDNAAAIEQYKGAVASSRAFRPPVLALVRLLERARSFDALADLYAVEARAAKNAADEVSAMLDHAFLFEHAMRRPKDARALYERALARDPSSQAAALMFEAFMRRSGDRRAATRAVATRAQHVSEPVLRRILFIETALAREEEGDIEGAAEFLRTIAQNPLERWRVLRELERIARKHDRPVDLLYAIEQQAMLAEAYSKNEEAAQQLASGSIAPFGTEHAARSHAKALFHDVALLRDLASDHEGALESMQRALELGPGDFYLRLFRVELLERAGRTEDAIDAASKLLDECGGGAQRAALRLWIADLWASQRSAKPARRTNELLAALREYPASPALHAIVHEERRSNGDYDTLIATLEARAGAQTDAAVKARLLWRAAHIAVDELGDLHRGAALYRAAASHSQQSSAILRELYGAALFADVQMSLDAADVLAAHVTGDERDMLMHGRYLDLRQSGRDADSFLRDALASKGGHSWIASTACVRAAKAGDLAMLATAHRMLAKPAAHEEAVAHLCCAARALGRSGKIDEAVAIAREAVDSTPSHAYAVTLLEELLRAQNDAASVVTLLREAASRTDNERDAELLLLRAVATAEQASNKDIALETCREAALRTSSASTAWTLLRLASARKNSALRLEALETLSKREAASGHSGSSTLALAEHDDLVGDRAEQARDGFVRVLDDESLGLAAAAALLIRTADPSVHLRALDRMISEADSVVSIGLSRARAALLLERTSSGPTADAARILNAVLETAPEDRWARYAFFRSERAREQTGMRRATALAALAEATSDAETGAELFLHAKWIAALDSTHGAEVEEQPLLHAIESAAPRTLLAAVALEESWATTPTASATADALVARLPHTSEAVKGTLEAALGRSLVLAGRPEQATRSLRAVVAREPDDLASWEALRVAARECGAWDSLVEACGKLAPFCHGRERAELLEELGVWLLDMSAQASDAERHLKAALEIDPTLPAAYARLHELLTARNEQPALLDVISARVRALRKRVNGESGADEAPQSGDREELVALLYEEGQLRFALGDSASASESLQTLLHLAPDHAPALALLAQTYTRLHQWNEATGALDSIANGSAPDAIRKIAVMAAAEIRTSMLRDSRGAYEQLRAAENTTQVSSELYARMADVAEDANLHEEAVTALTKATAMSRGGERARYQRRLAKLYAQRLGNVDGAVDAYRRALTERPTDIDAAEELAKLVDANARQELFSDLEHALLTELFEDPADAQLLRVIARAGNIMQKPDLTRVAFEVLDALGAATDVELGLLAATEMRAPDMGAEKLEARDFEALTPKDGKGRFATVMAAASESLIEVDSKEPDEYGVGRSALVKPRDQSPAHQELQTIAASFGLTTYRLYAGDSLGHEIVLLPQSDNKVIWIVGSAIEGNLDPAQRFDAGRQCMAAHLGTTSLLTRTPEECVAFLASLAQAGNASLDDVGVHTSSELVEAFRKSFSRRTRKDLQAAFQHEPVRVEELEDFCWAAQASAARAGLLVSGDLRTALLQVANDESLRQSLLRFWLSREARDMRRRFRDPVSNENALTTASSFASTPSAASGHLEIVADEDLESSRRRAANTVLQQLRAAIAPVYPAQQTLASAVPRATTRSNDELFRQRLRMLEQLERSTTRSYKARTLVSMAELLEQTSDSPEAKAAYARAREVDPRDVIALRRTRQDALRSQAWLDAVALIETEASLPIMPEERAFALGLASAIHAQRLGDGAAAESAAYRALMIRPQSGATALMLAQAQLTNGKTKDAQLTLERASGTWKDAAGGAALLIDIARDAERESDVRRARTLFKRAAELDPRAVDALLGVARNARALGEMDDAIDATRRIAQLTEDRRLADAFLRAGARMAHLGAHRPQDAFALLAQTDDVVALDAKIDAAEAIGDRAAMKEGLAALAGTTRRTDRAIALVRLAELELSVGNLGSAQHALREAINADASLISIRVLDEQLARRAGDLRRLTRVGGTTSQDALASAARTALHPDVSDLEKRLLLQATSAPNANIVASMLLLDAAIQAKDDDASTLALRRAVDHAKSTNDLGPFFAAVEAAIDQGRLDDAIELLQEVRRMAPQDMLALRWIMRLMAEYPSHDLAGSWLEEASLLEGERGAFAACRAARLLERSGGDASQAYLLALEKRRDYAPASWALAEHATRIEDPGLLREVLIRSAEHAASSEEAAEELVRAALHARGERESLLARAQTLAPSDVPLLVLRLRGDENLDAAARAALFEASARDGAAAWSRALLLRAAMEHERAGQPGHAAELARKVAATDPADALAERIVDRNERDAGERARVLERYKRTVREANDAASKAIALERLGTYELEGGADVTNGMATMQALLEHYPTHIATLRTLERLAMTTGQTATLTEIEKRFARLGDPNDAAAHARLATRLALVSENATGADADEILESAFDHVKVDAWLARHVEAVARAKNDARLLTQALEESASFVDDPLERTALELRLCESLADIRSPAGAAVSRLEQAVAAAEYPLAWEQLATMQEAAAMPVAAAESYLAASEAARSAMRTASLAYRSGTLFRRSSSAPERATEAFSKAADALEKATRLTSAPRLRRALLLQLQQACTELGDRKRAEAALQHLLRLFPGDTEATQRLAALKST